MIGRLLQANYFEYADRNPAPALVAFWMEEIRRAELLLEIAAGHPDIALAIASERTAVAAALAGDVAASAAAIQAEEAEERRLDRESWQPLRRELEEFRHERLRTKPPAIS